MSKCCSASYYVPGAYEISNRLDIDAALSINEYVAVAEAFFGGTEPRFVNGVLDRLAQGDADESPERCPRMSLNG